MSCEAGDAEEVLLQPINARAKWWTGRGVGEIDGGEPHKREKERKRTRKEKERRAGLEKETKWRNPCSTIGGQGTPHWNQASTLVQDHYKIVQCRTRKIPIERGKDGRRRGELVGSKATEIYELQELLTVGLEAMYPASCH
ncbi:hypothetical protein GE21DRAFT_1269472 [Neurospora crassa]|nr:hypothetical protein GE21DRAFT_1269472 [Neurospora crassa]